jgi:hypothetical protein
MKISHRLPDAKTVAVIDEEKDFSGDFINVLDVRNVLQAALERELDRYKIIDNPEPLFGESAGE